MKDERQHYWFPAKTYGWGWGLPSAWQGWVVLGAFAALLALGAYVWPPKRGAMPFVAYALGLCVVLVGICYWKGEPPAWRWGRKQGREGR
jgi:hypothetical protein